MPLQDQTLSISFNKGLNTKTDPKQIMPGELLTLQNGIFTSVQEILKRNGYAPLSQSIINSGTISAGNSAGAFNGSLTLADGSSFFSYSENESTWDPKGAKIVHSLTSNLIGSQSNRQGVPDFRACIGIDNTIFTTSIGFDSRLGPSKLSYSLIDSNTLTPIYSLPLISRYSNPNNADQAAPITFGSNFYALGHYSGSYIQMTTVSALNPSAPTYSVLVATVGASNFAFDAVQNSTNAYILYNDASDFPTIAKYDNTMTLVGSPVNVSTNVVSGALTGSLVIDTFNNYLWVFWTEAAGLQFAAYNLTTLALTVAPVTISSGTTVSSAQATRVAGLVSSLSALTIYYTLPGTATTYPYTTIKYNYGIGTGTSGQTNLVYNAEIALKPYLTSSGSAYLAVSHTGVVQPTTFLVEDVLPGSGANVVVNVVSKFQILSAGPTSKVPGSSILPPSNNTILPLMGIVEGDVSSGTVLPNYSLNLVQLTIGTRATSISLGNNLNVAGGQLSIYDGSQIVESGFNLFPEDMTAAAAGPGSVADGTYSYVATYEWYDSLGNLHRSAPSIPVSITVSTGPTAVNLLVFAASIGSPYKLQAATRVNFYRTQNGGTVYYKLGSSANLIGFTIGFADTFSDSQIIGNTQLYTTGGEVENVGPPPTNVIASFKNRIILVDAENPLVWWYSKQVIQGFPVEFSDLFTQAIDQRGGNIAALAAMDDKLIFFKEYNIFYVTGDGPAPSGANNDFSYPQIITTDVGCINRDSVVLMPQGLMFQSHKGIYLLDRGLGTSYIGAPVEQYNDQTITSATVIPNTQQVRFTLSSGIILVYDYFVSQWSVFTNLLAVDTVIYKNKYTILTPAGLILEETPGLYTDNGAAISLSIKTGWFSFGNLQGFQRIKEFLVLGESESNTSLTISLSHNFLPAINQTDVIPITANSRLQYRIFPQRQKCESMQITISDSPSAPLGEGLRLSALGFNIGIKKGLNKVPASNNYG